MDDLISRQAALEKVRAMQTYKLFVGDDIILVDKAEVQTELMMLPTAQPGIIRCKDCKKREHCRTTNTWAVAPSDDWFCADAERRTDD